MEEKRINRGREGRLSVRSCRSTDAAERPLEEQEGDQKVVSALPRAITFAPGEGGGQTISILQASGDPAEDVALSRLPCRMPGDRRR